MADLTHNDLVALLEELNTVLNWQTRDRISAALSALRSSHTLCPNEPTEEMWGELARDIMFWLDVTPGAKTPRSLLDHLHNLGTPIPDWLLQEQEMQSMDHSMSKGTRVVLIYRAMLARSKT